MPTLVLHALTLVALAAPDAGPCSARPTLVITNVHVIDVNSGAVQRAATITIGNGRICQISDGSVPVQDADQRVDGRGRFAVPGFIARSGRRALPDRAVGYGITQVAAAAPSGAEKETQLHVELAQLVAQGQSPLQALQSVTVDAALRLQIQDAGRLAEGLTANIVLLEANPLDNITNVRRISLVVRQGQPLGLVELARARTGRSSARQPFTR